MATAHHYRILTPDIRRTLRKLWTRYPRVGYTVNRIRAHLAFAVYGAVTMGLMVWIAVKLAPLA